MTHDGGDRGSKDDADALLRAIAPPPERAPETAPARIAHFRILGLLGKGGRGAVYRAEDETLRRTVAVKVLADTSGDVEKRRRFLREARSAAAITHPNVAVIHQIGEAEGRIYIAMELVEGENLRVRLDRGRLDVATALELARQIARGLAAAHDRGIVHRDLKPENVMITPSGVVKLLDFGLAKSHGDGPVSGKTEAALARTETVVTSDEGRIMGTPEYMSPEQAMGEPLDVRSDVFSFGTVLYEMLSGTRPFTGASTGHVLVAIARDAAPPLRERAPEVDEATEAVVMRCLAKARGERFGRAAEIVTALAGQVSPKATTQSRTDVEPITRSGTVRRGTRTVRMVAALLAVALVGSGGWWGIAHRARTPMAATSASAPVSLRSGAATPRCNPEGERLFEQGVDTWETESLINGNALWRRAVEADPDCGPVYLRLALGLNMNGVPLTKARAYYASARAHRDRLTETEGALLDAIEPYFAPDPDDTAAYESVRALASRFPDDALISFYAGFGAYLIGQSEVARTAWERTLALHPQFGGAYAMLHDLSETEDLRHQYLERCIQAVPRQTWCRTLRWRALQSGSDCPALERSGREQVATNPGWYSQAHLADGLMVNGAPPEAIEEAVRQYEVAAKLEGPGTPLGEDLRLAAAVLDGEYEAAEQTLRRSAQATMPDVVERASWAADLAVVLDDTGRAREADALVRQTLLAGRALARPADPSGLAFFYARAMVAGVLDRAGVDAQLGPATVSKAPYQVFSQWYLRQLVLARTPEAAHAALDTMPARSGSRWGDADGAIDYELARVRALAGDFAAAQRDAMSAVKRCDATEWHLRVPRAFFLLGEMSERTGHLDAAGVAYETVVKRWGGLKPKAVLADRARARLAVLPKH